MVRGNHENCFDKGGRGWFLFFDPVKDGKKLSCPASLPTSAAPPTLPTDYTVPYAIDVGEKLRLVVVDSANAFPGKQDELWKAVERKYREQFQGVAEMAASSVGQVWLLSHVPIWG